MTFWVRLRQLLCRTFCVALVSAQSAGIHLAAKQSRQRELWFAHGGVIPGQASAALRYQAHRRKLELRALHAAEPRSAGANAFPRVTPGTVWTQMAQMARN